MGWASFPLPALMDRHRAADAIHEIGRVLRESLAPGAHDDDVDVGAESAQAVFETLALELRGGRGIANLGGPDSEEMAGVLEREVGSRGGLGEVEHRPLVGEQGLQRPGAQAGFGKLADVRGEGAQLIEPRPVELPRVENVKQRRVPNCSRLESPVTALRRAVGRWKVAGTRRSDEPRPEVRARGQAQAGFIRITFGAPALPPCVGTRIGEATEAPGKPPGYHGRRSSIETPEVNEPVRYPGNRCEETEVRALSQAEGDEQRIALSAAWIQRELDVYYRDSRAIPELAKAAFEERDYASSVALSRRRLDAYRLSVSAFGPRLSRAWPALARDERLWSAIEARYLPLIEESYEADLALAYMHSVRRQVYRGEWRPVDYAFRKRSAEAAFKDRSNLRRDSDRSGMRPIFRAPDSGFASLSHSMA